MRAQAPRARDDRSNLLVAGAHQAQLIRDAADPAICLCDSRGRVVKTLGGGNEPGVDSGSERKHPSTMEVFASRNGDEMRRNSPSNSLLLGPRSFSPGPGLEVRQPPVLVGSVAD